MGRTIRGSTNVPGLLHREPTSLAPLTPRTDGPAGHRQPAATLPPTRRRDPDQYPVVRLKVSGYKGQRRKSRLGAHAGHAVVGKAPKADATIPDTSLPDDLNDDIPDFSK